MSAYRFEHKSAKKAFLGSALWGWATSRDEVFSILDTFASRGGGVVDIAANYPINNVAKDFGLASTLLSEWLQAHRPHNISVLYKVGSLDNTGSPETALTRSDVLLSTELARGKFGDWLSGIAVHWDNRNNSKDIEDTLSAISALANDGLRIGFSGVKRPDIYLNCWPMLASRWLIQVKENFITQRARKHYQKYFPLAQFYAYGINMGGVRGKHPAERSSLSLRGLKVPTRVHRLLRFLEQPPRSLEAPPIDLNQLAMMGCWSNPSLSGVILGPRTASQLRDSLAYWEELAERKDSVRVYNLLSELRKGD